MGEQALFEPAHEDQRELQALGRMQRHELNRFLVGAGLRFAGLQYRVGQELVQRRQFRVVVAYQPLGGVDQFLQVFHARFGRFVAGAPVVREQAARLGDPAHLLV